MAATHGEPAPTSADTLLDQFVRYATTQWDSAGRFATKAAAVFTLAGTVLAASLTPLLGWGSPISEVTRVVGTVSLVAAIVATGITFWRRKWSLPPKLDLVGINNQLFADAELTKRALVIAYVIACDENETWLKHRSCTISIGMALTAVGTLLLALSYIAGKAGV